MRRAIIFLLALVPLTACGRKGARSSDFDNATAAALASGGGGTPVNMPKIPHVAGFGIGHALDKHDMIFGGASTQFAQGDSILISVRAMYVPAGTEMSGRIRLKNSTVDSVAAKTGAPDSAAFSYTGLRFGWTKKMTNGSYQADIFLNGKYQMSQGFNIGQ